MSKVEEYISIVYKQLKCIEKEEKDAITESAKIIAEALQKDGLVYVFGTGHSQIFSMEMFYRAGGLIPVHPMFEGSVSLDQGPISSQYERLPEIGKDIFKKSGMTSKDVLIIVSHSGRNSMPIDLAIAAKEAGVKVITITSKLFMEGVTSRHKSGKFVKDFADVVIDNHCELGDAVIEIEGFPAKVAGTSTILSVCIVESMVAETINICVNNGFNPPVWVSGNLDCGDELNAKNSAKYRGRIPYL